MRPHHQRTVERLVEHWSRDERFPALLVAGSIARGWEREDSDVDVILLATHEEYERRARTNELHYYTTEFCEYFGGYVDGKIVNRAFLEEAAERGSEPARAAFVGSLVAYSRLPDLDGLLTRITRYPEETRHDKLRAFYAQLQAAQWYMGEAEIRDDPYLRARAAADLALYGGRLILARNRILYPYHKWFTTALAEAADKPPDLLERMQALLACPGKLTANDYCGCILSFADWDKPPEGWPMRFMRDTEWAWRSGRPPIADW